MNRWIRGFTLIELVVVMGLMAILLALAVPDLVALQDSAEQRQAAWDVLAILRLARSEAIRSNLEYQVGFDLDSQRYWLERGDLSSDSSDWSRLWESNRLPVGVRMATGANCNKSIGDGNSATAENTIQFNPDGTCGSHGTASSRYICILGPDGKKLFRSGLPYTVSGRAKITSWNESSSSWE